MMRKHVLAICLVLVLLLPISAFAHCDSLAGPVVAAARVALERNDVTPVLRWVRPEDEEQVRAAFLQTMAVRGKDSEARDLADRFFFETVVRLHRAAEGAPFTGLKPAQAADEPGILAVDRALAEDSSEELLAQTLLVVRERVQHQFAEAMARKQLADQSVEAGRAFVQSYVELVHYVEALYGHAEAEAGDGHLQAASH